MPLLSLSLSLSLSWWISLQTLVLKHFVREGMQWRLQEFCLGKPLKNFNKKIEYIELSTKTNFNTWSFTIFFYRFSNFKFLYEVHLNWAFADTENWNWKHCSKIIFKCVNSAVRPIFNEKKVIEKCNLWVHE